MKDRVKVLLSTYNGEEYLKSQLDSLYNQEDVEIKIFARDDHSTDNTIEILKSYHINYYIGSNLGAKNSFFDLIQNCTLDEEYYAFCDQDDIWKRNKLKMAINKLKEIKNKPGIYYCEREILIDNRVNSITAMNELLEYQCLFFKSVAAGCTIVINKELMLLLKQYKPKYVAMHDSWMMLLASVFGEIKYDSEPYMYYRIHQNNVIGLINKKGRVIECCKRIFLKNTYTRINVSIDLLEGYEKELMNNKEVYDFILMLCHLDKIYNKLKLVFYPKKYSKYYKDDIAIRLQIILGKI